jgi:hypothetical protein
MGLRVETVHRSSSAPLPAKLSVDDRVRRSYSCLRDLPHQRVCQRLEDRCVEPVMPRSHKPSNGNVPNNGSSHIG